MKPGDTVKFVGPSGHPELGDIRIIDPPIGSIGQVLEELVPGVFTASFGIHGESDFLSEELRRIIPS